MTLRCGIFIVLAGMFAAACSEEPADLAVTNANVLTVDEEFSTAEAVAIRDGIFVAVGSNEEIRRLVGDRTQVIDAGGKTVIPGLIESHSHATSVVRREYETPHAFEQLGSIGEIQRWLQTQAEHTPQGDWIRLPRVDVTRISEGRIPTPAELSEAAPDHPAVFVWQYANRQIQVLNSAAVEAAGITKNTPVPEGGKMHLNDEGDPTGVLEDSGELTARYLVPREIPEEIYHRNLERLMGRYNEVGITSIFERSSNPEGYYTYRTLHDEGRLPVRVTVTIRIRSDGSVEDTERVIGSLPVRYGEGDDRVRVGPLKFGVDGGILYGTALMHEPYGERSFSLYGIDDPDHRGTLRPGLSLDRLPEQLKNLIHTGQRMGWQMSAHVTGDAGVDAVLDAVEAADAELPEKDRRFTLIHAYFANGEAADRAAQLGVGVDTQPAWYYKDGDALAGALGSERLENFIGVRSWQDAGARVAINTDHMSGFDPNTSLNPYNPFLTMYTVITRRTEGGQVIGPEQRVSREDALRMMTINAAWLSFDEERKGSIEVGKLGDLAILSDDLMSVGEEQLKDIRSDLTVVGGKVVYEADSKSASAL